MHNEHIIKYIIKYSGSEYAQANPKSTMVSTGTKQPHSLFNEKMELIFPSRLSNIQEIFFSISSLTG